MSCFKGADMVVRTLIAVMGLGLAGTVFAGDAVIDQKVDNFFAKGMQHCKNAMDLSRTSRQVAAAEFDRYESYMGKVDALKPEFSTDIMISRQREQCDQVGHDIARSEALPLVEEGLAVCKEVRTLIRGDYITKAKARFLDYARQRDKAVALTDTVLKVGSNASKIRRCDRLEEKIIAAEQRIEASEIRADRLISALRKSNATCEVTQSLLSDDGVNAKALDAAGNMLSQAREYFSQTENYPEAIRRAENFPGYESSKQIRAYMLEYSRCDQTVAARLTDQRQQLAQRQQQNTEDTRVAVSAKAGQDDRVAEAASSGQELGAELVQVIYGIE